MRTISWVVLGGAVIFFGFALWHRYADRSASTPRPQYPAAWNIPMEFREDTSPEANAFRHTCSQCHALPNPSLYDREGWLGVVRKMDGQMKERGISISPKQIDLAVQYVITHTRRQRRPPPAPPASQPSSAPADDSR